MGWKGKLWNAFRQVSGLLVLSLRKTTHLGFGRIDVWGSGGQEESEGRELREAIIIIQV